MFMFISISSQIPKFPANYTEECKSQNHIKHKTKFIMFMFISNSSQIPKFPANYTEECKS